MQHPQASDEEPRDGENKTRPTLHSTIAACDENGFPKAFLNSDELTAYRTAMSAMLLYNLRANTREIVLFGAGKTALWHARLVLALRGSEINRVTVVNRSAQNATLLINQVQDENKRLWKSSATLRALVPSSHGFEAELETAIRSADAIFCTTGSKAKLFPAHYLTNHGSEYRSCYVSSIGSWQPDMVELDPVLLVDACASSNGIVVVDDQVATQGECGDLIQSGLRGEQIRELGACLPPQGCDSKSVSEMAPRRFRDSLVVYKSIGVGSTDLAAANFIIELAMMMGRGTYCIWCIGLLPNPILVAEPSFLSSSDDLSSLQQRFCRLPAH